MPAARPGTPYRPCLPSVRIPRSLESRPPVVAGLISVIVNYGGTFILVFQGRRCRPSPGATASWVWSVSIGVGATGLILSWAAREPIITAGRPRPPPSW